MRGTAPRVARDALVAGADSASLRLLAGALPSDPAWDLHDLAAATASELTGIDSASEPYIQLAALQAGCRRLLDGRWDGRTLAKWAYSAIGFGSIEEVWVIAAADDEYIGASEGWYRESIVAIDARVRAEAHRILAVSTPTPDAVIDTTSAVPPPTRRRGVLGWFRRAL